MTLRPDAIRERLALVRSNLDTLSAVGSLPRDRFVADRKEHWAAAYGLQSTVQALLDAGAHILSGRFKDAPKDYADIVPRLASVGVLEVALAARLAQVSGFRNVLVHEYAAVDFALVHDKLQHLDDLSAFAAALERWLVAQGM